MAPGRIAVGIALFGLLLLGNCSGESGGAGGGAGASGTGGGGSGGAGGAGLGACTGVCVPTAMCDANGCSFVMCDNDSECPATDKAYVANGPRCLSVCNTDRLCRTPCSTDAECPKDAGAALGCSGIADDGTRYCEIALTPCSSDAQCPAYTQCWPSFRPAP